MAARNDADPSPAISPETPALDPEGTGEAPKASEVASEPPQNVTSGTLPPLQPAQVEEVQRAEIHIGEPQSDAVPTSRRSSELPALVPVKPKAPLSLSRAAAARQDARRRIVAAREELERRVAEATESRLRRQAEQEETARRRAEEAQQRAKKRLAQQKKKAAEDQGAGTPSLPASTESRTPATSRSPRSPVERRRDSNDQELPGIKPAKARVRKTILKQKQEQEQRLREIEEDRQRLELRKKAEREAAEIHRLEAAKRAALRHRKEREMEEQAKVVREEELRIAKERQKLYRNPREIAKIIAEAQVHSQVEERRRSAQHDESYLRRERDRARRMLDGEEVDPRPFGKMRSEPSDDWDDPLLAKTVQALTDEDWKVNIKFS